MHRAMAALEFQEERERAKKFLPKNAGKAWSHQEDAEIGGVALAEPVALLEQVRDVLHRLRKLPRGGGRNEQLVDVVEGGPL